MNRRALLGLLLAVLAAPRGGAAQARARGKPYRLGSAIDFVSAEERARTVALLRDYGWIEGRDYTFVESGFPFGHEIERAAERIVAAEPDVIVTVNSAYAIAVRRRTRTIPIVMWVSGYPVEAGLAISLARPGGNVTGNTAYAGVGLWGKYLELLREAAPHARRVGVLMDYVPPWNALEEVNAAMFDLQSAARALGISLRVVTLNRIERLHAALADLDSGQPEALLFTNGTVLFLARQDVLKFAFERRLPTLSEWASSPEEAGLQPLLAYASPWDEFRRKAYDYVVRILRDGARPGDLPIQQPSRFVLTVSLRTARAIGLTIPASILLRADRVIE